MNQCLSEQQLPRAPLRGTPMGTQTGELSQAHSTFPEPSEGQMESPGPEITRLKPDTREPWLEAGHGNGKPEMWWVQCFHFVPQHLWFLLNYSIFLYQKRPLIQALHIPVLSQALRVDIHCKHPWLPKPGLIVPAIRTVLISVNDKSKRFKIHLQIKALLIQTTILVTQL